MRRVRVARRPTFVDVGAFLRQVRTPQRASALRSVIDGAIVARTLRRRGARPLLASLRRGVGRHDPGRATKISAAVDAGLGLLPMTPTCLRRSVTLLRELERSGLAANMHVGVRNGASGIEAHAWVQVGSVVVNDDPGVGERYDELAAGQLEDLAARLR